MGGCLQRWETCLGAGFTIVYPLLTRLVVVHPPLNTAFEGPSDHHPHTTHTEHTNWVQALIFHSTHRQGPIYVSRERGVVHVRGWGEFRVALVLWWLFRVERPTGTPILVHTLEPLLHRTGSIHAQT
jgi:hypothetical protein